MSTLREAAQAVVDAFADPNARGNLRGHWLHLSDCITELRAALAQQEPVTLPCCGYTDASAIKWNRFNGVVQCHNCGQVYTHPSRREWQSLTEEDIALIDWESMKTKRDAARAIEQALKEKNQ